MKKSMLALAVLSAFAGVASAQSSVTISGILDAAVKRVGTPTSYDWSLGSAGSAFDAITFSGREDMGGGLYAFFLLNHRFSIDRGTINSPDYGLGTGGSSSPTFWRNSYVGVGSSTLGEVRLGRILMPLQELSGTYDVWYGGYTVGSTFTGGITATQRANGTIYYRTPVIGGFKVLAAVAQGEKQLQAEVAGIPPSGAIPPPPSNPGGFGKRPASIALEYSAGPLSAAVAYDRNYADFKTVGVYAKYNFGPVDLRGELHRGDSTYGGTLATKEKVTAFSVSANIPFGVMIAKVGYLNWNSDVDGKDYHKIGLGGEYLLSKRTLIYSDVSKATGSRLSVASSKAMFDLGLRHTF